MNRFHVNIAVADLDQSIAFYRHLFGAEPTVIKRDYAKWMLDDPRINFSISLSSQSRGISHVGLQADTLEELEDIRERLALAGERTLSQTDAKCCYARSDKSWVLDPDNVAWEAFVTHGEISHYGNDHASLDTSTPAFKRCCNA